MFTATLVLCRTAAARRRMARKTMYTRSIHSHNMDAVCLPLTQHNMLVECCMREREREREKKRQKERQREGGRGKERERERDGYK